MLESAAKIIFLACLLSAPLSPEVGAQSSPPLSTDQKTTDQTTDRAATSPERQALIDELLVLTKQEENANQMLEAMLGQLETTFPQFLTDTLSKTTDLKDQALQKRVTELSARMVKRYRELLPQRIDIGKITTQINSSLYAKYYTDQELQELIDFYRSPVGQKTIEITPQLSQEALEQSNRILLPKMTEIIQDIMKEEFGQLPSPRDSSAPSQSPQPDQQSPDSKK